MPVFKNNLTRGEYARAVRDHPDATRALCFGDSWFQYVPHPTDLNKQLAKLFRGTLFLREGLTGRDSAQWKAALPRIEGHIASYRFDAILLSAGGNDVVGEEMFEFVKRPGDAQVPGQTDWGVVPPEVRDHVHLDTFALAMRYAMVDIRRVIELRDRHSPSSRIFVHTYDYIFPDGKAFKLGPFKLGPWVKPALDSVGLAGLGPQRVLTGWLVDRFALELKALVSQHRHMALVDSRGTLKTAAQWENEIHPTAKGFETIARQCWKPALTGTLR